MRTATGDVRGFYNVCRHRGSRLVMEEPSEPSDDPARRSGRFGRTIRCPYHSWTYGLDGTLRNAPFLNECAELRRSDLSLFEVGVETWGGFVFVHLRTDPEDRPTRSLGSQLGGVPERLRRYPLAALRTARRVKYEVGANWKVIVENYNECYHCGPVHPELCDVVPAFKKAWGSGLEWERGVPHRAGATTFTLSGTTRRTSFAGLNADERTRHKAELLHPNLMLSLSHDHVAAFTLWPEGPARTTVRCDFLFAPDEMAQADFDPSDAVGLWDLTNRQDWAVCESVQSGMAARPFRFGLYAPMEDASRDVRRYVEAMLRDDGTASLEMDAGSG